MLGGPRASASQERRRGRPTLGTPARWQRADERAAPETGGAGPGRQRPARLLPEAPAGRSGGASGAGRPRQGKDKEKPKSPTVGDRSPAPAGRSGRLVRVAGVVSVAPAISVPPMRGRLSRPARAVYRAGVPQRRSRRPSGATEASASTAAGPTAHKINDRSAISGNAAPAESRGAPPPSPGRARLVHERGFAASGVKDITDAAGVPKGSFYAYFPSKEAFAAAVLDHYWSDIEARILPILDSESGTARQRITRFFTPSLTNTRQGTSCSAAWSATCRSNSAVRANQYVTSSSAFSDAGTRRSRRCTCRPKRLSRNPDRLERRRPRRYPHRSLGGCSATRESDS